MEWSEAIIIFIIVLRKKGGCGVPLKNTKLHFKIENLI